MLKQTIEFPGLGLEFDVDRVAFHLPEFLGGLAIYWYGIIIALGFAVAIIFVLRRTKLFGVDPDRFFDVVLVGIIVGVFGARLFSVVFSPDPTMKFWDFRGGGLAIYGGLILGSIAGLVTAKIRKVRFLPALDLAVGGFFIGQAIGRWGNFINVEAFGGNTSLPWGMIAPETTRYLTEHQVSLEALGMIIDPKLPVHPTFLYESLWCLAGFALIIFFTKRRRFDGQLSLFYMGWYGIGRFFIEGLRTDSLLAGSVRVSRLIALVSCVAAVLIMIAILSRIRQEGDPEFLKLYVNTDDGKRILDGTFYPTKEKNSKKDEIKDEIDDPSDKDEIDDTSETQKAPNAIEEEKEEDQKEATDVGNDN